MNRRHFIKSGSLFVPTALAALAPRRMFGQGFGFGFRDQPWMGRLSSSGAASIPPPASWWKADDITGKSDGDSLATWLDSSGNGNHLTQATGGSQPVYKTNRANGLPAVNFGTINASSYFDIPRFFAAYTEGEIFLVLRADEDFSAVESGLMALGGSSSNDSYTEAVSGYVRSSFGTNLDRTTVTSLLSLTLRNWRTANFASAAYDFRMRMDGVEVFVNVTSNPVTWPGVGLAWLGKNRVGAFFHGDIAEILFYPSVLSSGDRATVQAYLTAKYRQVATSPAATNLVSQWKADAISASDGDSLASWNDTIGTNHLTQATGAVRPKYKTNRTINGLPAVNFGTLVSNSYFTVPYFFGAYTAAEVFLVWKLDSDPNTNLQRTGAWTLGGTTGEGSAIPYSGTIYDAFGTGGNKYPLSNNAMPNLAAAFRFYNVYSAAGDWRNRVNGKLVYQTTSNTVSWQSTAFLGRSRAGGDDYYTFGDIAELLFYSAKLSATDRATTELYIEQKYGLAFNTA